MVPASPADDNGPKVLGSAPAETTVRLYVGGGCAGEAVASVSVAELEAGVSVTVPDDSSTTFRATATTAAENASGCSEPLVYVEDSSPPDTTIGEHPASLTNSASADLGFSGDDGAGSGIASFECRLDGGGWEACASPRAYAELSEGSHGFEVRAVDAAGNADGSPASFGWTVDTTPPTLAIDSGPDGLTNDPTPTFGFGAEAGASLECSLDEGTPAFGPCSGEGAHGSAEPLADGPHTFRVRAADAAGNEADGDA